MEIVLRAFSVAKFSQYLREDKVLSMYKRETETIFIAYCLSKAEPKPRESVHMSMHLDPLLKPTHSIQYDDPNTSYYVSLKCAVRIYMYVRTLSLSGLPNLNVMGHRPFHTGHRVNFGLYAKERISVGSDPQCRKSVVQVTFV